MRNALAALVVLVVALAVVPAVRADAPPPDVQAIMERLRAGHRPTAAEQQRLRTWMSQASAPMSTTPPMSTIPADDKAPTSMVAGELRIDLAQETRQVDGAKNKKTAIDGSVTVPVFFAVRDEPKGAVRILFRADPKRHPRGGAHLHAHDVANGRAIDDDLRIDATEAPLFSGELYADPSRPRAYLRVSQTVTGDLKKTRTTRDGTKPPVVETATAHTVLPLLPFSYDEFRADVPWLRGLDSASLGIAPAPPMTPEAAAKLAPEIREATEKAKFDLNARALASALRASKPFKLSGKYAYGTIKNAGSVRTTTSSRVTLELSIPKP